MGQFNVIFVAVLLANTKFVEPLPGIGDIQTIANFANDAWGVLNGDLPISALLTGSTGVMLDKIMDAVNQMSEKLDVLADAVADNGKKLDKVNALLDRVLVKIPLQGELDETMREFRSTIGRIDFLYNQFLHLSNKDRVYTQKSLLAFVHDCIGIGEHSLGYLLVKLANFFVPGRGGSYEDSLLYLTAKMIRINYDTEGECGNVPQRTIYELYKSVAISEIRGYIMTLFSYSMLSVTDNSTYYGEMKVAKNELIDRTTSNLKSTKSAMMTVPRYIQNCDSSTWTTKEYATFNTSFHSSPQWGRTLATTEMRSNVKENMVVTGIRFQRTNGIIYLQIEEGKLMPYGQIAPGTERWVPFKDYDYRYYPLYQEELYFYKGTDREVSDDELRRFKFWKRSIELDDVIAKPKHVLIGVSITGGDILHLEIIETEFNYETGELRPATATSSHVESAESRRLFDMSKRLSNPLNFREPNVVDTGNNMYLSFENEEGERRAGLVPYIDIRPVYGQPSVPLTGIGLFHRGHEKYGGFLSLRGYGIDLPSYIDV